jgi:hypothetical protein
MLNHHYFRLPIFEGVSYNLLCPKSLLKTIILKEKVAKDINRQLKEKSAFIIIKP